MKKTNIIKAVIMGAITAVSLPALSHFSPKGEATNVYKSEVNAGVETDELEVDDGKVDIYTYNNGNINVPYIYYPSDRYVSIQTGENKTEEFRVLYYYDYDGSQVFTDGMVLSPDEAQATVHYTFNNNGRSNKFAYNGIIESRAEDSSIEGFSLLHLTVRVPEEDFTYHPLITQYENTSGTVTGFSIDLSTFKGLLSWQYEVLNWREISQNWDIIYRAYQKDSGWTEWGRNGEVVGDTEEDAEILTKVQINVVRKGSPFPQD